MAKSKVPKNLQVDGTDKLAARSKPSDKHEKEELTIEEATVASPRSSRKRAGDYFDFDEGSGAEEPPEKATASKARKPKKNLQVDGTDKLAARSKPSDKHEQEELNIEEATVASPRPSKKRAGDYFEFDEGSGAVEPSKKAATTKTEKPKKKEKTAATEKTKKPRDHDGKKDGKEEKIEGVKSVKGKQEKTPKSSNLEKSNEDDAKGLKKTKKTGKKSAADGKSEKSKASLSEAPPPPESATITSDVAMDQAPFESLMEHDHDATSEEKSDQPHAGPSSVKGKKNSKKASKEPKSSAAKASKSIAETAAGASDTVKESVKDGAEKVKKTAKAKTPTTKPADEVADDLKKGAKETPEQARKAAKSKLPSMDTPAEVADAVHKEAKATGEKVKKAAKSKLPSTDTPAEVAGAVHKEVKAAGEKAKKAVTPKEDGKVAKKDNLVKHKDVVKKTAPAEQPKPESSKSKKRKAPIADAEAVKADLLDPLNGHAEASAKKKQKKDKAPSKSIGDAVGGLLSTAAEGASAARASLGGFASSLLGAASDNASGAAESAKAAAKKAKGKGKAIAEDVAESSGKAVAALESAVLAEDDDDSDSDAEPDDHTAALLAGFESEGNEASPSGTGYEKGQKIPELPNSKETTKKIKAIKADADGGTGVIYVGRIPHGFYEHEMRQYFSQFGDINRLRLSRNRKTGASKHYAFIEFKSAAVAKIAAETMDNYLLFGHILKCKVTRPEQLHEDMWKGANKRFKPVPWNKLEGRKHEVAVSRDHWKARNENEEKRRQSKKEKMQEIGYDFDAPPLKSVDEVPVKDAAKKVGEEESVEEQEQSLVTGGAADGVTPMVVSEEVISKKVKKSAKGSTMEKTTTVTKKAKRALEGSEEAGGSKAKKVKKTKGAAA